MALHTVTLASEIDSAGFRREARLLLTALVAPDEVRWLTAKPAPDSLFASCGPRSGARRAIGQSANNLLLPRSFMSLCETVLLHKAASRFGLLYSLLWRAVHEPGLMSNRFDPDRLKALHMAQAVRRDMQKMKNLIRFHEVGDQEGPDALHLAWYVPDHHIVESIAPFFVRRLQQPLWAILAPERCVRWRSGQLDFAPGLDAGQLPAGDADVAGWFDRYRSVFDTAPAAAAQ